MTPVPAVAVGGADSSLTLEDVEIDGHASSGDGAVGVSAILVATGGSVDLIDSTVTGIGGAAVIQAIDDSDLVIQGSDITMALDLEDGQASLTGVLVGDTYDSGADPSRMEMSASSVTGPGLTSIAVGGGEATITDSDLTGAEGTAPAPVMAGFGIFLIRGPSRSLVERSPITAGRGS